MLASRPYRWDCNSSGQHLIFLANKRLESRCFLEKIFLIIIPETNIEDARLTLHFNKSRPLPNNVSIGDIEHASQTNDATAHFEGFNRQLNNASQRRQELLFEAKLAEFNELYRQSRSATARNHIYHELIRKVDILKQEERRENEIQDPSEMTGPRIFGKGGPRRKTGAELVMKELKRRDKPILQIRHQKQSSISRQRNSHQLLASVKNMADDLISGAHLPTAELAKLFMERDPSQLAAPQRPSINPTTSTPLIVDLTDTTPITHHLPTSITSIIETISQSQISPSDPFTPLLAQSARLTGFSSAQIGDTDPEIEIIEIWTEEEFEAEANSTSQCRSNPRRRKLKHSLTECKNYTTSSHATSSHAPILHRINIRIHFHLPLPIQEPLPSLHLNAASSHLHPIIILFFYRLFRKVYAMSNGMYLFLPIDRFLRTRSRNLLMYLDPLVSLRFSSFELVLSCFIHTVFCSVPVVPILSHVPTSPFSHRNLVSDLFFSI